MVPTSGTSNTVITHISIVFTREVHLVPRVQKDFLLVSKFGLSLATGFHVTLNTEDDYQFQGGELQSVRLPGGEPRVPVKIYGKRFVETVTFFSKARNWVVL